MPLNHVGEGTCKYSCNHDSGKNVHTCQVLQFCTPFTPLLSLTLHRLKLGRKGIMQEERSSGMLNVHAIILPVAVTAIPATF
jgi:hypothetical protein